MRQRIPDVEVLCAYYVRIQIARGARTSVEMTLRLLESIYVRDNTAAMKIRECGRQS